MSVKKTLKHKEGFGAIFVNDRKFIKNAPDYKGLICLDQDYKKGRIIRFGGWFRPGTAPNPDWISVSISHHPDTVWTEKKDVQYPRECNKRYENTILIDDDEDIPT